MSSLAADTLSDNNVLEPSLPAEIRKIKIDSSQCSFTSVTIFRDRAEVTRSTVFPAEFSGEYELKFSRLCKSIDVDSIRVKGNENVNIIEVGHELGFEDLPTSNLDIESILKARSSELGKEIKKVQIDISLFKNRKKFTESYINGAFTAKSNNNSENSVSSVFHLEEAKTVLNFYGEEMSKLDKVEFDTEEKLSTLQEELQLVNSQLRQLNSSVHSNAAGRKRKTYQEINVIVDVASANVAIPIQFSYVVTNASWFPSYDIRITNDGASNLMSMSYFAEVTQSSGEDWKDCEIFLSTSDPAIGSSPPPLPLKTVNFNYGVHPSYGHSKKSKSVVYSKTSAVKHTASLRYNDDVDRSSLCLLDDDNDIGGYPGGRGGGMNNNATTATVKTFAADTSPSIFVIPRRATIASDNKPHKVTIAQVTLTPMIVHYVAPSLSTSVYLQAKTKNTSDYPFLASDKVSVFLEGNFVSTSSLKLTTPSASFTVYLGVDPGFKAEYLPPKITERTRGWMSGSSMSKSFSHTTILHNTKGNAYRVIVAEVLPQSSNEKIVVDLLKPSPSSLSKPSDANQGASSADVMENLEALASSSVSDDASSWPKDFVSLNKATSSIVWLQTINPGEKAVFKFDYQISWPQGQFIEIN